LACSFPSPPSRAERIWSGPELTHLLDWAQRTYTCHQVAYAEPRDTKPRHLKDISRLLDIVGQDAIPAVSTFHIEVESEALPPVNVEGYLRPGYSTVMSHSQRRLSLQVMLDFGSARNATHITEVFAMAKRAGLALVAQAQPDAFFATVPGSLSLWRLPGDGGALSSVPWIYGNTAREMAQVDDSLRERPFGPYVYVQSGNTPFASLEARTDITTRCEGLIGSPRENLPEPDQLSAILNGTQDGGQV